VPPWNCADGERQFGRPHHSHECSLAMSLEVYFSTGPDHERLVFEAVMAHLRLVGPVHVEPAPVAIFPEKARTFAELRPMTEWVVLSFSLPRAGGGSATCPTRLVA